MGIPGSSVKKLKRMNLSQLTLSPPANYLFSSSDTAYNFGIPVKCLVTTEVAMISRTALFNLYAKVKPSGLALVSVVWLLAAILVSSTTAQVKRPRTPGGQASWQA